MGKLEEGGKEREREGEREREREGEKERERETVSQSSLSEITYHCSVLGIF